VIREVDRVERFGRNEERERSKKVDEFERFICERENLQFDSLIYLEPVERF